MTESFAVQLKRERLRRKLSQEEVAARAEMKQGTVSRLETNNPGHSPTITTMMRLAQAVHCNLEIRLVPK